MEEYKYLFSVIVPVYNTEKYIEECIESLVNQTIGFENIQLILINDGSTDNSEEICLKYKNKYPDNIVYELKQNGGQASARNTGYKYIEGKYVNFLDSDDKFQLDTFFEVYKYFEEIYNKVNFIMINIEYFEDESGGFLPYIELNESSILNINSKNILVSSIWNCFFKSNIIKNYLFDINCKFGDDFKLINNILIYEENYGYLNEGKYYYRICNEGNAISNFKFSNFIRFNEYLSYTLESLDFLIKLSIKEKGKVIDYIQLFCVASVSFWYMDIYDNLLVSDKEYIKKSKKPFLDLSKLYNIIQYIDDKNIIEFIKVKYIYLFFLQFKYKKFNNDVENIDTYFLQNNGVLYDRNLNIREYLDLNLYELIVFKNNKDENILKIEGNIISIADKIINKIYFKFDEEYFLADIFSVEELQILATPAANKYFFKINLDYEKCRCKNIEIYLDLNNKLL